MSKSDKKKNKPVKEKEPVSPVHQKSSYTGKTPKQIISKHIRDKNDVITDNDFKNLNISVDTSGDTAHELLEIPDDNNLPKAGDSGPAETTPWDLIKE